MTKTRLVRRHIHLDEDVMAKLELVYGNTIGVAAAIRMILEKELKEREQKMGLQPIAFGDL